jgi:Protein of unknown function (DUF2809)
LRGFILGAGYITVGSSCCVAHVYTISLYSIKNYMKLKILYTAIFIFCVWLALATRQYTGFFHPLIVTYGGDIIWAGMFLFFMRIFFLHTSLLKLAVICYAIGVAVEFLQLYEGAWYVQLKQYYIGRLLLGVGFLWSDLLCYAIGTVLAYVIILLIEKKLIPKNTAA